MSYLSTNVTYEHHPGWLVWPKLTAVLLYFFIILQYLVVAHVSDIINAASWVNQASCDLDPSARRKTSKYFGSKTEKESDVEMADASAEKSADKSAAKRKLQKCNNELKEDKPVPAKKKSKDDEDDDDDFVAPAKKKTPVKPPPSKKPKVESNVEAPAKTNGVDDAADEDRMDEDAKNPSKGAGRGRGRGGRGAAGAAPAGRGRGGGGRGFMNFGERKDPPHKGEKVTLISLSMF